MSMSFNFKLDKINEFHQAFTITVEHNVGLRYCKTSSFNNMNFRVYVQVPAYQSANWSSSSSSCSP